MFKRRTPRSYSQIAQDFVYPRGGWRRAGQYIIHRLRRLPDPPQRIGRGVAAGVFVCFTPFFGVHLAMGVALAWILRGNILAAILGTLVGNPLTLPFIAVFCVSLGRRMLGMEGQLGPQHIVAEIARAMGEIGSNVLALASERTPQWAHLATVAHDILLPYLIGGLVPGIAAALLSHAMIVPLIEAYKRRRLSSRTRPRAPLPKGPPR